MKTLMVILALAIGTTMGANAQTQTQSQTKSKPAATTQPHAQATASATAPAQSMTMMKVSELPKSIQDNLSGQFKGWTASKASKIDSKGVITYEVTARKETSEMNLLYDKDGKLLKQAPVTTAKSEPNKGTAPATQHQQTTTTAKPAAKHN
jgi:hypothetical protein